MKNSTELYFRYVLISVINVFIVRGLYALLAFVRLEFNSPSPERVPPCPIVAKQHVI